MSDSQESRDVRKKRLQTQNQILTVFGCGLIVATSMLSVMGARFAINSINRDVQDAIVYAKQHSYDDSVVRLDDTATVDADAKDTASKPAMKFDASNKTDSKSDSEDVKSFDDAAAWSDEQVRWLLKNGITYNNSDQLVDSNGNILELNDDGNFFLYPNHDSDVQNAPNSQLDSDEHVSDVKNDTVSQNPYNKPDTNTNWGDGIDGLERLEDGTYRWIVQPGDTLGNIARQTGFSVAEIVENNHLQDENWIYDGDILVFPQSGPIGTAAPNLGLG